MLTDLRDRYDVILDALEREGDWVTNRTRYGRIILDSPGGIESGIRQLIRARPLETEVVVLPDGNQLTVPTIDETLRIKAFLIVKRNQTRDYLDVAALADTTGVQAAARVLLGIDDYYAEQSDKAGAVSTQVASQLADPQPADRTVTRHLDRYKGLANRWHDWKQVVEVCQRVADEMLI